MSRTPPRVWITGIGLVAPFGPDGQGRESSWRALRDGICRPFPLRPVDRPDDRPYFGYPAPYRDRFSPGFDPWPLLIEDCAREALADAGLTPPVDRLGVVVGLSKGRVHGLEEFAHEICGGKEGTYSLPTCGGGLGWGVPGPVAPPPRPSPTRGEGESIPWPKGLQGSCEQPWIDFWPDSGASQVRRLVASPGPTLAPVAACATGLVAAIRGAQMIRRGECDRAIVGAVDASLTPFLLGAFRRMRALAEPPAGAVGPPKVRPWDRRRGGFLVGEGGALLLLEREDHARGRGVSPYAELAGGALGADARHMTDLDPDPANLAGLIGRALESAVVEPETVDHINAHGTATRPNDPLECRAIRRALGRHADSVSCSANKSQIGHLLGAAGAVELAFTALAIRDQFAPPTLQLDEPDPACDLDGTPHVGRAREIRAALKLSLGFGGHLAAAVLRRVEGHRREPLP